MNTKTEVLKAIETFKKNDWTNKELLKLLAHTNINMVKLGQMTSYFRVNGHIETVDRGIYKTTEKGFRYIKAIKEKEGDSQTIKSEPPKKEAKEVKEVAPVKQDFDIGEAGDLFKSAAASMLTELTMLREKRKKDMFESAEYFGYTLVKTENQ